jgi:hypothetical protein
MDDYIKICTLENLFEAQRLEAALIEQNIPFVIENYSDSAYDGIFQAYLGWGSVKSTADYRDRILAILRDLRDTPPEEPADNSL